MNFNLRVFVRGFTFTFFTTWMAISHRFRFVVKLGVAPDFLTWLFL